MQRFLSKYTWENVFYLLSAWLVASPLGDFEINSQHLPGAEWDFPLSVFHPQTPEGYLLLVKVCTAVFLIMAFLPKRWPFFGFATWMVVLALMNSFGKHSHSGHGWALAALGMTVAFFIDRRDHRLRFDYAIVAGTSIYCASGFWKLRELLGADELILAAQKGLPSQMAFGLAEHYRADGLQLLGWLQDHSSVAVLVWCAVILTQIFTPVAILLFDRWRFLFILVLVLFHVGAQWTVGPAFKTQRIFLLFMAVVSFYYEWWEPSKSLERVTSR